MVAEQLAPRAARAIGRRHEPAPAAVPAPEDPAGTEPSGVSGDPRSATRRRPGGACPAATSRAPDRPAVPVRAGADPAALEHAAACFAADTVSSEVPAGEEYLAASLPLLPPGPVAGPHPILAAAGLGAGVGLPDPVRAPFELALGADLSGVRVHTGPAASRAVASRAAAAFTLGQHIVFGEDRYAPGTPEGRALLAHELAHTVQQRCMAPTVMTDEGDGFDTVGPATVRWWPKRGLLGATLNGQPWVTVRWDPGLGRTDFQIELVGLGLGGSGFGSDVTTIGLRVRSKFPIKVIVNREAESRLADSTPGKLRFLHDYSAGGRPVVVNDELPTGRVEHEGTGFSSENEDQAFDLAYNVEFGRYDKVPLRGPSPTRPFAWRFETRGQLDAWALAHPDLWWVEGPPDGATLQALHADEKGMQALALRWRDEGGIEDVRTVYEHGVAWASPDLLWDLFYSYASSAQAGPMGDAGECLVFQHGLRSFGRVALSHDEALAAWQQLEADGLTSPTLAAKLPRGTLVGVAASGQAKEVYLLGELYLTRRTRFFDGVRAKRDPAILLDEPGLWSGFLRIALDRPMGGMDPALKWVFDLDSGLWEAAGEKALENLRLQAKWEGIWAVQAAMEGIGRYRHEDGVKILVLQMPDMKDKERHDSIAFLGFEGMDICKYAHPLRDRDIAARVWMGEDVGGVSTAALAAKAATQYQELEKFEVSIENGDVDPLWDPGAFGAKIRERVYKKYGFTMYSRDIPDADVPDRLNASGYGSELAYAFARGGAAERSRRRFRRYLMIAAVVAATVVLVLVANAAGAALAGMLFLEGTVGFVVVELAASAAIVTLLGPAVNTMVLSGGAADLDTIRAAYGGWGGLGKSFALNLMTFGFFKALGAGARGLATAGAGGAEAFGASLPWRAVDAGLRVSTSAVAMYGISALTHHLEGQPMPTGEAADEQMFETGLSLLLMELGGLATRGLMKDVQTWARDQRLGGNKAEMDALLVQSRTLSGQIAEYAADPFGTPGRGEALLTSQLEFLAAQEALIANLRSSFRTRGDAKQLEARLDAFVSAIRAQTEAVLGYQVIAGARIRPVSPQEGNTEFTYRRGKHQEVIDHWTRAKATVRVDGDVITVTDGARQLTYRPATDTAAGVRPDGTRVAEALQGWRADIGRDRLVLLADAAAKGHLDADVRTLRDAKPATSDAAELRRLELAATRLEAKLKALTPQQVGQIDRFGTDSEGWRMRMFEARKLLLARAEALGLGADPSVAALRRLQLGRSGLKDNTLANYEALLRGANGVVDKQLSAMAGLAKGATGGPPTADLQAGLVARRADVQRRAETYGVKDGTQYLENVRRLRPGSRESAKGLVEAEAVIAKAEAKLDARAKKSLVEAEATHGKAVVDAVRADPEFALWTDAQVGDALWAFGGNRNRTGFTFTPESLRGAMWMARGPAPGSGRSPIPMARMVGFSRSPAELTFVLETYGRLRDLSFEGSFDVIRRAASSPESWKGAVWQLWVARSVAGLHEISAFEVKGNGREIDIQLRNGGRIECKDWPPSSWNAEKVSAQTIADLEGATRGGTHPDGIKDVLWLFRPPGPRSPAFVRSVMRTAMETWIAGKGTALTPAQASALRTAFDLHADLVQISPAGGADIVLPPRLPASGMMPPRVDDDDKTSVLGPRP